MTTEKKHFRLFPEVIFVPGPVGGAIYLLLQRKVFALDAVRSQILTQVENNCSLEETADHIGISISEIEQVLNALTDLGAGCFVDRPCFVEKIRPLNPVEDITFFRPAPRINILHLSLTGKCSQKCIFCEPGKLTPRLQPCLGCHREVAAREQTLPLPHIKKALEEAASLGCHSLVIHAGDPHITEELLLDTILTASKYAYTTFDLITGTPLSEGLINRLMEMKTNTTPVFQVYSDQESVHDYISGKKGSLAQLMQNVASLREHNHPFKLVYLFTGQDPDPYDVFTKLKKLGPLSIYSDRLLKNIPPVNDFIYGSNYLIPPDISTYIFKQKNHTCLHSKLALNWNGKYYPCPLLPDHELGHVLDNTIQDIFAQERIQKYWQHNNEQEPCFGCEYRVRCEYRFACHQCIALFSQYQDKKMICGNNPDGI